MGEGDSYLDGLDDWRRCLQQDEEQVHLHRGTPLGGHGPSAVFAFYPNKQMATGEGGVVTTHSEEEWRLLRSLRNQGRSYDGGGGWFHHVRLGLNYRWTDVQAAIGLGQLERVEHEIHLAARELGFPLMLKAVAGGGGAKKRSFVKIIAAQFQKILCAFRCQLVLRTLTAAP